MNQIKLEWKVINDCLIQATASIFRCNIHTQYLTKLYCYIDLSDDEDVIQDCQDCSSFEEAKQKAEDWINKQYNQLDKLTWHNLIKSPEDLPPDEEIVEVTIGFNEDNYSIQQAYREREYWQILDYSDEYTRYLGNDELVCAWRYLSAVPKFEE